MSWWFFFFFTSDSLDFYFEIKYKEVHCCWGIYLVQEARGAAAGWAQGGSPRQGPMKCSPCAEQRSWDLWPSQWIGLSETQQQPRSSHFPVLRLGRYKNPGFPFFWGPPQRHQLELIFSYLGIAPRLNHFKYWDVWDSITGNLRLMEAWSASECGVCRESSRAPVSSLAATQQERAATPVKGWRCDFQTGSWMIRLGSFPTNTHRHEPIPALV